MPPKKKDGGKKANAEPGEGEDPEAFLAQYKKLCKVTAIPECEQITQAFSDEENPYAGQFVIHPNEPMDPTEPRLGPGGARALALSILGSLLPQTKEDFPFLTTYFKPVKSLRIWWSNIGDEGCKPLADLLRLGGAQIQINYLELWDNNIGPAGALALGRSLMVGSNRSLLTLKLDYNRDLGTEGVAALCRGLRTNSTLKQLHLPYCNIDSGAGAPLSEMLTYTRLGLTMLNLKGNQLRGEGLLDLCKGIEKNRSLVDLDLSDNDIGEEDVEALSAFAGALMMPTTVLANISLLYNRIGVDGANALLPALDPSNKRIQQFLVDETLPPPLFEALSRVSAGGK
eukprot:CAMPEP_0205916528 /NCGR_PEP_ID=MMETSP1325-20131115/8563_1 /ASSEMBLY_ACC=CAM_ASM_000708 /TAXON_ID=236786 /ORGANISM="Florenciella sp., Strain RCC1007" /LENGTH=341 /DNA_ID=CAMNT_0053283819 /DNA_START=113 /DNA_END=1135 /DNA_ORIENTATION=+